MKRSIRGTFVGLIMLGISLAGHAATLYVDRSGSETPPYNSWGSAAKTIPLAVEASAEGDTILVNDGTYVLSQAISLTNRTLLSASGAEKTIIDNPLYLGVLAYGSNALIRGFSITGGETNNIGIGIAQGATMDACRIYGNHAIANNLGVGGVAVASGTIMNTMIYSNTAEKVASQAGDKIVGGVFLQNSVMSNCEVFACSVLNAETNGDVIVGGVYVYGGQVYSSDVADNIASGRVCYAVGGVYYEMYVKLSRIQVRNNKSYCAYVGTNSARAVGGVSGVGELDQETPLFEFCSIVSNTAEYLSGEDGGAAGGVLATDDEFNFTNRIIDCEVSYNEARVNTNLAAMAIGGIYANYSRLTNVNIIANKAFSGKGKAIGGFGCDRKSELTRTRVNHNEANASHRGAAEGGVELIDCMVRSSYICNNSAVSTGACVGGYMMRGTTIRSSLIAGNVGSGEEEGQVVGGGVARDESVMESCTVAGNRALNGALMVGGAVFAEAEVWNCIFFGNEGPYTGYPGDPNDVGDGMNVYETDGGETVFMSCCFPTVNAITNGVGSIDVDPQFIRADAGNYRLLAASPCRGSGVTQVWMSAATDVVGLPRVFGGMLERGAYEFIAVNNDFDGDGKSDVGCYYDTGANWYIDKSTDGFWTGELGAPNTDPVTGDFDGDGLCDYGVYDPPSGAWAIQRSAQGPWTTSFGYEGTVPVTGDFDGDSTYDFGCYYAPRGDWYIYQSTKGFWHNNFGYSGTVPVTGDFDGDGKCDFGCYYAPSGAWYIYKSSEGFWVNNFGYSGTVPITGDFDGDGRCDFGCYYAPGGNWYIYKSSEGFWMNNFGYEGTIAITGDYDGDGKADFGCYYPTGGNWYIYKSTDGFWTSAFGYAGTVPIGQ